MHLNPWNLLLIAIAGWMNREQAAVVEYLKEENEVLRELLGKKRRRLAVLGKALGRKEDAIREGKIACDLRPVSRDVHMGPERVEELAFIYTLVGEHDAALDQIEYLLSIPSKLSVALLRLDPRWDPLRDHPRYQDLLRRHGFEADPSSDQPQ